MGVKGVKSNSHTSLIYYNVFGLIYIPLIVFGYAFVGNLYDIGDLNWYYPLALLFGEVLKAYYLWKTTQINNILKSYKELIRIIMLCMFSTIIFDILEVCAGAPFFESQSRTVSLAIMLTILTVLSPCLTIGYDKTIDLFLNISTFSEERMYNRMIINVCGTLIGTWLGAVVIPLDWDRPWQVWPIPCYFSGLLGNMIGNLINILPINYKQYRHNFVKP